MKNFVKVVILIVFISILGVFFYLYKTGVKPANEQLPIATTENSIVGCYVVDFNKDVYTLTILSQLGESFKGRLVFKNFEKDSSSGTFEGTYKNGILLGDYSFQSEGMDSVMQVIFKRLENNFIRGYGDVNATGDHFVDTNNIVYDSSSPLSVFKKFNELCAIGLWTEKLYISQALHISFKYPFDWVVQEGNDYPGSAQGNNYIKILKGSEFIYTSAKKDCLENYTYCKLATDEKVPPYSWPYFSTQSNSQETKDILDVIVKTVVRLK